VVFNLCLLLIVLLGFSDHLSGFELSFSVFYLIPISIAAWYIGKTEVPPVFWTGG